MRAGSGGPWEARALVVDKAVEHLAELKQVGASDYGSSSSFTSANTPSELEQLPHQGPIPGGSLEMQFSVPAVAMSPPLRANAGDTQTTGQIEQDKAAVLPGGGPAFDIKARIDSWCWRFC